MIKPSTTRTSRIATFATTFSTSLFLAGLFIVQAHGQVIETAPVMSSVPLQINSVPVPAAPQKQQVSAVAETPMREVHIANNGLVLLRDAYVVSISRYDIVVRMQWDETEFDWNVSTLNEPHVLTRKGEISEQKIIHVGSRVTVTGKLNTRLQGTGIDAEYIRML